MVALRARGIPCSQSECAASATKPALVFAKLLRLPCLPLRKHCAYPTAALQARIAHPTAARKRPAIVRLSAICTFLSQISCAAMVTCSYGPNDTAPHGMAIYATKLGANTCNLQKLGRPKLESTPSAVCTNSPLMYPWA